MAFIWVPLSICASDKRSPSAEVATALANGDVEVEGIDPDAVTDSVEELMAIGFLESVLVTDHLTGRSTC